MDAEAMLREKGWGKAEAKKTAEIIARAEASKTASIRFIEQSVFWAALLVAILGNFIISVVLVPFLLLLEGIGLYATISAVGVTFGLLFNVIIGYIEKLNEGQHIIAGAFIPALALINVYIIAYFSNRLEILLQLPTQAHNPLGISITYVAAFVFPYVIKHFQHLKEKRL